MRTLFNAGMTLAVVALFAGQSVPNPRLRAVAAELHQAHPQAHVEAQLRALFHQKN